jgi:ABC-type multidrug transport system ATPase subunit
MVVTVSARSLRFEIGGSVLLNGVSFEIQQGQLCAVVGPSGAGKSTLLKLLCGIKKPSAGAVLYRGAPLADEVRSPDLMGYVPQDDIVHRSLTVERVLRYAAELRLGRASRAEQQARVEAVLGLLGLAERRRLRVRRLSGGQRKRVSIGVELVAQPAVLFLDEPTSGLDPGLERQLMHTLRDLAHGERTVVLTTHVMETMDVVDLLAVVYDGHLAFAGPPARALEFFRVAELRDLFDQLKKRPAAAWSSAYERERARLSLPAGSQGG